MGEATFNESNLNDIADFRERMTAPIATGARVVVMKPGIKHLSELVDEACKKYDPQASVSSFTDNQETMSLNENDAIAFDDLGIAIIDHHGGEGGNATIAEQFYALGEVEDTIPEFYAFAIDTAATLVAQYVDTQNHTWGLQALNVPNSQFTGEGVRVAVLDTGIDVDHPDLKHKIVASRSFVSGELVDDFNGHGTHCCGTVAGALSDGNMLQYGVAPSAELVVGKVLSNGGSGRQRDILAGMIWAVQQGATVVSMSLGRATRRGEQHDPAYERAAQFALNNGSLVVAASGNESDRRFGYIAPVGAPANSPSVMAVAAVDQSLSVADFSCGSINPNNGVSIDIAAPGVSVLSSWPLPQRHRSIQGTSMACPHVAGIAALLKQSNSNLSSSTLAKAIVSSAKDIGGNSSDLGAGLVQAP